MSAAPNRPLSTGSVWGANASIPLVETRKAFILALEKMCYSALSLWSTFKNIV